MKLLDKPALHAAAIVLLCVLLYANALNAPFVLDDIPNISDNLAVRHPSMILHPERLPSRETGILLRTRPLGYLSFALNYKVHGASPAGYRAVNVALHAAASLLLYWLALILLGRCLGAGDAAASSSGGAAFFAALLFAAHPLATQSVTYVVQRFALLAAFFYLLAVILYIKARLAEAGGWRAGAYLTGSVLAALAAVHVKENAATLPLALLLVEAAFLPGPLSRRLLYIAPFAATAVFIPMNMIAGGANGGVAESLGGSVAEIAAKGRDVLSPLEHLLTQAGILATYLRLSFLPIGQNLDYDYPVAGTFADASFGMLLLAALFGFGVFLLRRRGVAARAVGFGILWFFVAHAVESAAPIADVIFEHRMYLPMAGLAIAAGAAYHWAVNRGIKRPAAAAALCVILVFSILTVVRNSVWADDLALWRDTASKSPDKHRPHHFLGAALYARGDYVRAEREFEAALGLDPDSDFTAYSLGMAYYKLQKYSEAAGAFGRALALNPGSSKIHETLGITRLAMGSYDAAMAEFRSALAFNPRSSGAYIYIGEIATRQGRTGDAALAYRAALGIDPSRLDARLNLGVAYALLGDCDSAVPEFAKVLALDPASGEAKKNLDACRALMRR